MYKAVIFDLDGTLIDSEKYYRIAWKKAFSESGYTMSDSQYLSLRSLGRPFVQPFLKQVSGDENFDYPAVLKLRSLYMEELIQENGLEAKKGAALLLDFLKKKNVIRAVATASPAARAQEYLSKVSLLDSFDRIISARDVKEGKPSPDVYLEALKNLGLNASECLAAEDSPNGVLSAYHAGIKVIMIPDQAPCDEETRKYVFREFKDLSGIITLFK